jgi:hypothetical protein
VVERGPEKAGVGGSIPSLATILSITYDNQQNCLTRDNKASHTLARLAAFSHRKDLFAA